MKKLLLILLCLPFVGIGQTWSYSSGGNDFDGKYRTSSVVGTGTDYPYDSPRLVVNFFENTEQINFYIADAGYFPSNSNTSVKFSFSNEKGTIYKSKSLSYSSDRGTVFLGDFFSPNNIKKFEIFQKLMSASYVNVRISNDYGRNDLKFSLKGSSKAIKYVIPYEEMLADYNEFKMQKELSRKKNISVKVRRDSLLNYHLKKFSLSNNLIKKTIDNINYEIKKRAYINFQNIDSVSVWKTEDDLSVEVFFNYLSGHYNNIVEKSSYTFWWIVDVEGENVDSVLTLKELNFKKTKDKSTVEPIEKVRPKRKDYKSSNDYFKALREYNKKKKQ